MARLLETPDDNGELQGRLQNDLLSQFFQGFPISFLGELLRNPHDAIVSGALFIADELEEKAISVLDDVIAHTAHANPHIRTLAFAAICSVSEDGRGFVHVCRGILDPDPGCRKVAMWWMSRVSDAWLKAAFEAIGDAGVDKDIQKGLALLLGESSRDSAAVQAWILDQSPLTRKCGVIAAGRLGESYLHLLSLAAKSEDVDVATCATVQERFLALRLKWHEDR